MTHADHSNPTHGNITHRTRHSEHPGRSRPSAHTDITRAAGPERSPTAVTAGALRQLVATETRLLLREPVSVIVGLLLPTALLMGLALVPMLRENSDAFGGMRFIDTWAPTSLILGMCFLGLLHLPSTISTYREAGILRRMSTTPVSPSLVLVAQLIMVFTIMTAASVLLVLAAWLVLDIPLPQEPLLFVGAFAVGSVSLVSLGMVIAALAPNARAANTMAMILYFAVLTISGIFLPRIFLPDFLVRLGDVTPPGVQLLMDGWLGTTDAASLSHLAQLGVIAGIGLVSAVVAARFFRWE